MIMDYDPHKKPFPILKNDCVIRAALGLKTDFVPVWIMRQAGRHLSEYQELKKKYSFFEIIKDPALMCEVTLYPIKRYNLDAAIIFTDISVISQALGMTVTLNEQGLHFPNPLKIGESPASVLDKEADVRYKLHHIYEAITLTRHALNGKCPLFGFAGAPWTIMAHSFRGIRSKTKSEAIECIHNDKEEAHQLLQLLADKIIDHLVEQVKAGAQILQLFESRAGLLTPEEFKEFSYPYILRICTEVKARIKQLAPDIKVPIVVFAKGAQYAIDLLGKSPCSDVIDVISLDYDIDIKKARQSTNLPLQGNFKPEILHSFEPQVIRKSVEKMINDFGTQKYIANLGDGICPEAKMEAVKVFVDLVHEVSREYNKIL